MRFIFLVFALLFACFSGFSQTVDVSRIDEAKVRLQTLQKELWQLDVDERGEAEIANRQSLQKGEFETTKQFEARQEKLQNRIREIEVRTLVKTGTQRDEIHNKMNEILRTDFSGDLRLALGRYDADTHLFGVLTNDGSNIGRIQVSLAEAPEFKADFSKGRFSGRRGLLLNGDNKVEEYLISARFDLNGKSFSVITPPFDQARAMQMLFGNYDSASKTSTWRTFIRSSEAEGEYELSNLKATPVFFKPFKENTVEKYLLVANTEPYKIDDEIGSCHACYGLPSIAVFTQINGFWKVEMALKHGGEIGGYGDPGTPSLVRVGPEKFAVKFSWNNGRAAMAEGAYYWRLDGRFPREILNIYTSQASDTDYAPSERISFRTTTAFLPSTSGEFSDVKVTTVGRKAGKVGSRYVMKPFTKTEIYVYSNGRYKLKP